jgi:threonine dehydrogenase-like Zn-dependent dehydrogenase
VLCRTLELGICGTDREILHSAEPAVPEDAPFLVLGHECLARVETVGAGVAEWQPGDLCVPLVRRAVPGTKRRPDMLPWGQFVERGIYREHGFSAPLWLDRPEYLLRVPPALANVAVLTEPLAVAFKAVHEAMLLQQARLSAAVWREIGPRVLVTGQGPIAFAAALVCRDRNWAVTMSGRDEPNTFRAGAAERLKACYRRQSTLETPPDDIEADGFDLVLECTGSDEVMLMAARWLASCGVMAWLGSTRQPQSAVRDVATLMREALVRNNLLLGCVNAAGRDFEAALACLASWQRRDREALQKVITARVSPEEAAGHFGRRERQGIKTVVVYRDTER